MDTEIAYYTLRRIMLGYDLVAMCHILYFAKGVAVVDFMDELRHQAFHFALHPAMMDEDIKTVDELFDWITKWSHYYESFGRGTDPDRPRLNLR